MIQVIPYSYDDLQTIIKNQFINKGYDAGYDGSNSAILAEIIAYIFSQVNLNVSYNINERLLTQATNRKHVLEVARELGYESQNKISYEYDITLVVKKDPNLPDTDTSTRVYQIPKYSQFSDGAHTYIYTGETITRTLSNADITNSLNISKYFTIRVKEGTLYKYSDNPDTLIIPIGTKVENGSIVPLNYINVPYENVEENGIDMYVTYVDSTGILHTDEPWSKSSQFLIDKDSNLEKKYFRLQDFDTNTPKLYFNISGVGTALNVGSTIKLNLIVSSGSTGAAVGNIFGILDLEVSGSFTIYTGTEPAYIQKLAVNGRDEEDIQNIKTNAPLFHNTANRAVTKNDYISICERQLSVLQSQVWGGDEEVPLNILVENKIPIGHIWFSFVPSYINTSFSNDTLYNNYTLNDKDNTSIIFISDEEIKSTTYGPFGEVLNPGVFDVLQEYKIMTMQFHHRHPIYIDFEYTISIVKYNMSDNKQSLQNDLFSIIHNHFTTYIEFFQVEYFNSNLIKRIDKELLDLSGLELKLKNYISIYPKNIYNESIYPDEHKCTIFLAIPYENFINYENGYLIPGILPEISTQNFITNGDSLSVDWSTIENIDLRTSQNFSANIMYNGQICGKYYVDNSYRKHIRIDLYVLTSGGTHANVGYDTTLLTTDMFSTVRRLNLSYKTPNFRTYKNSRCRLTAVSFI
jgi:hypothetical protein